MIILFLKKIFVEVIYPKQTHGRICLGYMMKI